VTERAQVLAVHDGSATLQCFDHQGCKNCGSAFCNVKARTYEATVDTSMGLKPGDQVEVYVPPAQAIAAGFAVLIFPLLLFLAGYFALGFLDSEAAQVGAGMAGLALGFAIVYLAGRGRKKDLPRIVRVFHGPELVPVELPGARGST
jgi:positive regulator of sigma E activity